MAAKDIEAGRAHVLLTFKLIQVREHIQQGQSDSLGLTVSDRDVRAGEALGDAFDTMWASLKGIATQIGAAIAQPLTMALTITTNIISMISQWIQKNRELVVWIAAGAFALVAAGVALVAIGGFAMFAGFAIAGLIAAMSVLTAVIGFLVSPLGLVSVAFIAGVAAAYYYRDEIIAAVVSVYQWLRKMVGYAATFTDVIARAFDGLGKAIMSGNLVLAAQIAFTKMELEIVKILNRITGSFTAFLKDMVNKLGQFSGIEMTMITDALDRASSYGDSRESEVAARLKAMNKVASATYFNPSSALGTIMDLAPIGAEKTMKDGSSLLGLIGQVAPFGMEGIVKSMEEALGVDFKSIFAKITETFGGDGPGKIQMPSFAMSAGETKLTSKGTFSAAGAALLASGSDFQQQTAKNTAILVDQNRQMMKQGGNRFR